MSGRGRPSKTHMRDNNSFVDWARNSVRGLVTLCIVWFLRALIVSGLIVWPRVWVSVTSAGESVRECLRYYKTTGQYLRHEDDARTKDRKASAKDKDSVNGKGKSE